QQVRGLEARLAERLVERQGRGVALTETGQRLARNLSAGFETIRQGWQAVEGASEARPVTVTMTPTFATHWFMPRYSDYLKKHPDGDLIIRPSVQLLDPATDNFDVAIRFGPGRWKGLVSTLLHATKFVIVGAPQHLPKARARDPESLTHLKWFQETGTDEVQRWMEEQGIALEARTHVTELPGNLLLSALREGHGIAATARLFVEDDVAEGRLAILWESPEDDRGYHILHRDGVLRPQVKQFVAWLKTHIQSA
ncbi:MAG: LysR family transcriptional regulator, partial [Pseudomonadota bacterium]